MRWWRAACSTCLCVFLTLTVLAQQVPPNQQEAIDKAHVDILKTGTDKAAEAGRLTDALSDAPASHPVGTCFTQELHR